MGRSSAGLSFGASARLAAVVIVGLAGAVVGCGKAANGGTSSAAVSDPVISTTIPFVGCAEDGQNGPQAAPAGPPEAVRMTAAAAAQLAYYDMQEGPGVIGPHGWSCAGIYGSDGATLVVAPQALQPSELPSGWSGAAGNAIEARVASGDTSGRFVVAQVIMRVFPAHQAFALGVINEGIEPPSSFPAGPYPTDKLTTKSNEVVEFQTPAGAVGLGTDATLNERLAPGADPVSGVVILSGDAPDLSEASVRLPAGLQTLAPAIVQHYEQDNPPTTAAR